MPTTSEHSIYFADGNTPDELDTVTAAMASSVDAAIQAESLVLRAELNPTGTTFPLGSRVPGEPFWNTATGIGYRWSGTEWLAVEGRLPYARARRADTYTQVTGTISTVPFTEDKEESHPGSINAAGHFIVPIKGVYRFEMWVAFAGSASTTAVVTMRGQSSLGPIEEISRVRADTSMYGNYIIALNAGQYFQFRLQRSVSGATPIASTVSATRFQASYMRPV